MERPPFTEHIFEDRNQIKAFEDAINSANKDTREVEYALLFQMHVTFNDGTQKKYKLNVAEDVSMKNGIFMSADGQGYVIPKEITNELRLLIYKH
jgi:flavin-binding protein dodecin